MAGRIRTVKPELVDDERLASVCDAAFRIWTCGLVLADDFGNFHASPSYLSGRVFWGRPDPSRDMLGLLQELSDAELIMFYAVRLQLFGHYRTWEKHQRIDNAGKPRVPGMTDEGAARIRELVSYLAETRGGIPRLAATPQGDPPESRLDLRPPTSTSDPEGDHDHAPPLDPVTATAERVIAHLNGVSVEVKNRKPIGGNLAVIRAALNAGLAEADLLLIVDRKAKEWIGNAEMERHLKPSTLFGAKHRQEYLEEAEPWHAAGRPPLKSTNGRAPVTGREVFGSGIPEDF